MKQALPMSEVNNPLAVLRKAGYSHFVDPNTNEQSFILRLSAGRYPRMHLYVEENGNNWSFNLHIDQKQASYGKHTKHSGEYEGPTVEREMTRILKWVASETGYFAPSLRGVTPPTPQAQPPIEKKPKEKRGQFGGIF